MNAQVETLLEDPIELLLAQNAINLARARSRWASVKDFYRPILNAFQRLGIEPRLSNDLDIAFAGDAHKLAAVVRILRTNGFTTQSARPEPGSTTWYARYKHPEVPLDTWLSFTSSVCKRVKVGTKMVEEDIYEVQCGDISAMVDEQPALTIVPASPELESPEIPF